MDAFTLIPDDTQPDIDCWPASAIGKAGNKGEAAIFILHITLSDSYEDVWRQAATALEKIEK